MVLNVSQWFLFVPIGSQWFLVVVVCSYGCHEFSVVLLYFRRFSVVLVDS